MGTKTVRSGVIAALAGAVLAGGCGQARTPGAAEVPDGVIARVGERTLSGDEFESFMAEVRASYEAHNRPFPQVGSPEHANLTARAIEDLVTRLQDEDTAARLGVTITDEQVEATIARYRRANDVERDLREANVTLERLRADVRSALLRHAIFRAIVASARPKEEELREYYDAHRDDYTQWPPRTVDYLFVKDEALARELYERIRAGEDFLALAETHGAPGVRTGRITMEDGGPGLLPFELAAFTLEAGAVSMTRSGVGWSIVRPVSPREPGTVVPFQEVRDSIRVEVAGKKRRTVMDAWKRQNGARLASITSYRDGWSPSELRRDVPFPRPPQPQRTTDQCALPDGEYTYEQLVALGCAAEFPIPGVDGPPCPEPLVENPYVTGFEGAEIDSGYVDYLTSDEGACVMDPRGQTIGIYHRPRRPHPLAPAGDG